MSARSKGPKTVSPKSIPGMSASRATVCGALIPRRSPRGLHLDEGVVRGEHLFSTAIRELGLVGDEPHAPSSTPGLRHVGGDPHGGIEDLSRHREAAVEELLLPVED